MKKINDLKVQKSELISKMEVISENENLTEDLRASFNEIDTQIKKIDEDIAIAERQESLNKTKIENRTMENTNETQKSVAVEFRDWLKDAVTKGITTPFEYRAGPLVTTDGTGSTAGDIIPKTVANSVDILQSPAETFLHTLGLTFYNDLGPGSFVVPRMDEDTAAFVAEGVTAADASMNFKDLILAPRRVTHYQSISKELLSNVSPAIYASILQNLRNGIWNAVTNDVFDTLDSDAGNDRTTARAALGGSVTFTDIVNMEASINALNIGAGAYVTTPLVKGYLKKTAALTNQAAIWSDGEVNGYPAYAAPAVNAEHLVFGDFSRQVVGTWGPLEIILDPFTGAKTGTVTIVASMLADSGCANPKAFVILSDTSTN